MRSTCRILIVIALLPTGCSMLIARSGSDLSKLTTRELVHEKFGEPSTVGRADGESFEEFRTRRKIAEPLRSASLGMGIVMTYGLGEFICFPYELYLLVRRTAFGQDVRFTYNSTSTVTRVFLDGK